MARRLVAAASVAAVGAFAPTRSSKVAPASFAMPSLFVPPPQPPPTWSCSSSTAATVGTGNSRSHTRLGMATWSNGQAIKEYQDFLASGKQEIDITPDGPSVIVTSTMDPPTNLADALVALGEGDDVLVRPGQNLPPSLGDRESYPIYVALPPWELRGFLQSVPDEWKPRREDMVFFSGGKQCGVVEHILKDFGMARDSMTQVLASGFTLPGPGRKPMDLACNIGTDLVGEDKWAGESAACGKWQGAIAERLERHGIRCKLGFYREWRRLMWERAVYDAVFNVIGAVREEPTDHYDVAAYYNQEVSDMSWEMVSQLRGALAVTLAYGFEDRMFSIGEQRGKDDPCELTDDMYPYLYGVPVFENARKFNEYLHYAKDVRGLLQGVDLPASPTTMDRLPIMRQGNLRADGAI